MTFLPSETRDVEGLKGDLYPDYKIGPLCSKPGCSKFVDHAHHLWRRSFTAGPYSWVRVGEWVVGNIAGICNLHHELITVNKSRIVFEEGVFTWFDGNIDKGPLQPQPPVRSPVTSNAGHVAEPLVTEQHDHEGHVTNCPECKRPLPRKFDGPKEGRRPRKSWTITVPADRQEDGADVLDVLLESIRLELSEAGIIYGEERNVRYFILSTAMALFVQNAKEILT